MNNPFLLAAQPRAGDDQAGSAKFYLGIAADVSNDGVSILFDGMSTATEKRYKQLDTGAKINTGDRIIAMKVSGSYVVLGGISAAGSIQTAAPHTVLAGPSSGSADGEVSFRTLIAADLPNVPASKLPTVPINKGGSGQTAVSHITTVSEIADAKTNWNVTSANYYAWGKLAMLVIDITATAAITPASGDAIATIVSGKRPAAPSSAQIWLVTNRQALIKTNGDICIGSGSIASGAGFTILASYLLP